MRGKRLLALFHAGHGGELPPPEDGGSCPSQSKKPVVLFIRKLSLEYRRISSRVCR
jgi:hypothetical protein